MSATTLIYDDKFMNNPTLLKIGVSMIFRVHISIYIINSVIEKQFSNKFNGNQTECIFHIHLDIIFNIRTIKSHYHPINGDNNKIIVPDLIDFSHPPRS